MNRDMARRWKGPHGDQAERANRLIAHAIYLLDAAGDGASAVRLRHAIAAIRRDGLHAHGGHPRVSVTLLRMALTLLERDERHSAEAADAIRGAIDDIAGTGLPMTESDGANVAGVPKR